MGRRTAAADVAATEIDRVDLIADDRHPRNGSSVDAVFSATAWHWFDGDAALHEVSRILRRTGGLAPMWNLYDETEP